MESQLTISPANFSASTSDNAVLPAPVGPTMATSSGSRCSPCVAGISVTLPMNGAPEARDGEQQQQQRDEDEGQRLLALRIFLRHRRHSKAHPERSEGALPDRMYPDLSGYNRPRARSLSCSLARTRSRAIFRDAFTARLKSCPDTRFSYPSPCGYQE